MGPKAPTTRSTIRLRMVVESTGDTAAGRVGFAVDGKGIASVPVENGYARIVLPKKLSKGKHVVKVRFRGTATAGEVTVVRTIRVR